MFNYKDCAALGEYYFGANNYKIDHVIGQTYYAIPKMDIDYMVRAGEVKNAPLYVGCIFGDHHYAPQIWRPKVNYYEEVYINSNHSDLRIEPIAFPVFGLHGYHSERTDALFSGWRISPLKLDFDTWAIEFQNVGFGINAVNNHTGVVAGTVATVTGQMLRNVKALRLDSTPVVYRILNQNTLEFDVPHLPPNNDLSEWDCYLDFEYSTPEGNYLQTSSYVHYSSVPGSSGAVG